MGLVQILMKEGVGWVGIFPSNITNNPCGELDGIRNFMVRDERYAVAIADGFSRVSNGKRFGVCSVMGSINSAGVQMAYGALAQAYEDGTPLLCLTDGVPPNIKGRERFKLEEAFQSVTKWSGYINKPERVPEFMRIAYTQLRSGRPAPVLLQIPDGLGMYEENDYPYNSPKGWRTQGDPNDVKKAVRTLLKADRPLIWAGQGVFYGDACQELQKFAELVHVPVLTTLKGKSAFPENHPLSLGVRGLPAERFMHKSDLILTIGVGFNPSKYMHSIPSPLRKIIIQCTVDESDINKVYPINHAVIGDAKLVLQQLITEVQKQGVPKSEEK
jgi:acetolactate synthase-1/2/3 large subunit